MPLTAGQQLLNWELHIFPDDTKETIIEKCAMRAYRDFQRTIDFKEKDATHRGLSP